MPFDRDYAWGGREAVYGASLASNVKLATELGYTLVGCGMYSANGFYVRDDLVTPGSQAPLRPPISYNGMDYQACLDYPVGPVPLEQRFGGLPAT